MKTVLFGLVLFFLSIFIPYTLEATASASTSTTTSSTTAASVTAGLTASASTTLTNVGTQITTTTNNLVSQAETFTLQTISSANQTAISLYNNATQFYKDTLAAAQEFAKGDGLLAETVSTSLQLIGLGSGYTTSDQMLKVCAQLTYVNYWRQCTIHQYKGYWCCAVKNLSTGNYYCQGWSDAEAKKKVDDTTDKNSKVYCSSVFLGLLKIFVFSVFILIV